MTGGQILAAGAATAAAATFAPELLPLLPDLFLDGAADAGLEDAAATLADEGAGGASEAAGGADEAGSGLLEQPEAPTCNEPGNCFVAGTLVTMGDGTTKPIEQVKVGEQVLSRDEKTGQTTAKKVVRTYVRHAPSTLVLHFSTGETVECTPEHPFYVVGKGFMKAGALGIGTSIVTRAGPSAQVTKIELKTALTTVYNFKVENFHSYFVGKSGLWVHNANYDPSSGQVQLLGRDTDVDAFMNSPEYNPDVHINSLRIDDAANITTPGPWQGQPWSMQANRAWMEAARDAGHEFLVTTPESEIPSAFLKGAVRPPGYGTAVELRWLNSWRVPYTFWGG